ncbi:hemerythrin domain-containing protein [Acidiferrobacter sp.]|uniref:hemerythrin domain-containing protein n=1 Tax=Acidiferrobacter sp. TaxID=1872107 RepID=UPI0026312189|nr:hemerythrin domain-containing protein [Acidiferrobacter sp.]
MRISEKGERGAPGFDDPLGLLHACHERIEGHCATLVRLAAHVRIHGGDREAQAAAGRVHHYFAQAGRWHHEDEERDLAPLLQRHADSAWSAVVARLMSEHRALERAYAPLEPLLRALPMVPADLPIEPYVSLMRAHMAAENTVLLPRARAVLEASEIAALGRAMAARRGVRL